MRNRVVLLCITFLFIACNNKRIGNDTFVVTKDGEGNLQSEIHYINDTLMDGLAKYYYYPNPKNVLREEIEFKNGKMDGWYKYYWKSGKLESKSHFKDNLPDGKSFSYYENGKPKEETFWIKGKQYGDAYYYYSNGNLKLYNCINSWGQNMYALKYDSVGNKIKEEGLIYSTEFVILHATDTIQTLVDKNKVKVNREIAIKTTVSQPPQTKTIIRMGELNKNMVVLPIENYTATYKQAFNKIGKHTLLIVGEIKDLQGKIMKYDSTSVILNVIN